MQVIDGTSRRREYPFQVRDLANLPDKLRQIAEQALMQAESVKTIFVIPGQMRSKNFGGFGGMHWVPEQALLFTEKGIMHMQAGKTGTEHGTADYLSGDNLLFGRVSLVILYGRMELYGVVAGSLKQIVVEYNSVSHEMMQPAFLNFLRLAWKPAQFHETDDYQNLLLSKLEDQSYKFRSGLEKHCLQADEHIQGFVFQPRIVKHYFRIFHRRIAPASLVALSDRQLILIEEGMAGATSYGYSFTYCPRGNVASIEGKPKGQLEEVCIILRKDGDSVEHRLTQEPANGEACQALWRR